MFDKIGFIGCGSMGGALIRAVAANGETREILISGKGSERSAAVAKETGALVAENEQIASECSLIFLAVKPQVMPEVLDGLKECFAARKDRFVIVTIAAGLSIDSIRSMAGGNYPVIRIMPNLPVSAGSGTTLYCFKDVNEDELDSFLEIMKCSGIMCPVEERLIDAGSAVSGCGPAFAFMFIEAMADGGVACGLPRSTAQLLAAQTLAGSAKLLMESGKHPGELKDNVCSPGGTTIEGVLTLEAGGFRSVTAEAVISAYNKTVKCG